MMQLHADYENIYEEYYYLIPTSTVRQPAYVMYNCMFDPNGQDSQLVSCCCGVCTVLSCVYRIAKYWAWLAGIIIEY